MNNTPPRGTSPWNPMLLLLFVGSGCAALIYEIVWFQLLQLVIGLTSVSLGLLLGVFMGGMCLGSLFLPRLISSKYNPLRVYAVLEIGIAVIGILLLFLVPWVSDLYTGHAGSGLSGIMRRGGLAALCLLPPTILMGATLPAIARSIQNSREGISWLGFFYGGNIVGAVFGSLLAGFYLLPKFDMATATYVAASINVAIAVLAQFIPSNASTASVETQSSATDEIPATPPAPHPWSVYAAIALSGMAALGAEVIWTRLLSLIMGGTVYTFSIILAVFLVGLGIGSSVGALISRTLLRPRMALSICQFLLMGAVAWGSWMIANSLPYWPINPSLSTSPWFNFQLDLARGCWVVLPAAILWGSSFPLALAAVASGQRDSGRLVGGVYAANTVGAILGALLFSLVIVPHAGTKFGGQALVVISALAALMAWGLRGVEVPMQSIRSHRTLKTICFSLTILVATLLLARQITPIPWGLVGYGRFMQTYAGRLAPGITPDNEVPSGIGNPDIFCSYMGEGVNGTIAVSRMRSGIRNFHSAGKIQASSEDRDMRLQRMLGHISALSHPKPESVLVVACGAGVTAGTFVTHPDTKRIVICDIEQLVPAKVAPVFSKENYNVVGDPRTQVVCDDGRHFIRTTQEKFDIITSDPIDPWVKGCAALNTVEYYESCKKRLKPGGVISLWVPLYESNNETVKSIVATFFKVFPQGILWSNDNDGEGYDTVLMARLDPTVFNLDEMQARLDRPDHARVKESLADVGFRSITALFSTYAGQAADLKEWMSDAQINTDGNLRLQYLAGWAANSFMSGAILDGILKHRKYPENLFVGSEPQKEIMKSLLTKENAPGTSQNSK